MRRRLLLHVAVFESSKSASPQSVRSSRTTRAQSRSALPRRRGMLPDP